MRAGLRGREIVDMKRIAIITALLSLWGGTAFGEAAPGRQFQEGVHYFRIDQAPVKRDSITVVEVFSYLCSHCNTFEPYMQAWAARKPENVALKRIPVGFGRRQWEMYAKAYVTASLLGVEEQSHVPMMDRLWKDRKVMRNLDEIAAFYSRFGVGKDTFLATAQSFAVDAQLRREQRLTATYGITGTPSIVVNGLDGDYRISSSQQGSVFDTMLAVVDYLIARDLATQAAQAESAAEGAAEPQAAAN
jgi:thiol:disulfide interchange protein DsbA